MPTIPYYNSKGERLPGVTTVKGNIGWSTDALVWWAWKEGFAQCQRGDHLKPKDTVEKAADIGTIAHYMIECDIKGLTPDLSSYSKESVDKAETAYLNFLQWKQNMNFKPIVVEPHFISEVYQFGGTPDLVAEINGKPSLFDWKSGSGLYADTLIQLAAYRVLWEENNPDILLAGGFHLVRIDRDTASFTYKYWHDLSEAWETFLLCLELHKKHKILSKLIK
jgi:hypothetical protein